MRFILGLLIIALGTVIIFKTEWIISNFGTSAWAENKFATSGGSRTLYKLIGLIIIFLGMLIATDLINNFLSATVGRVFLRNLQQ